MYSKDRGYTTEPPVPRHLSYRQPERPRMQVPPNYSGHAIVDGEERPLGQVEDTDTLSESPTTEGPVPHFDDLPKVSQLGDSRYRPPSLTIPVSSFDAEVGNGGLAPHNEAREVPMPADEDEEGDEGALGEEKSDAEGAPTSVPVGAAAYGGVNPSTQTSLFNLSRFPFGHGIGWEEILILGLIWLLLHENAVCGRDRGDLDETVILLGLLLLLG